MKLFCLCHNITYLVTYYQFLPWYNLSFWYHFVILLTEIQFSPSFWLLSFPLLSQVEVIMWAKSSVCCLEYAYSCFSSHFCFLVFVVFLYSLMWPLLLLASVNSFPLIFFVYSLGSCIDGSLQSFMLMDPLPSLPHH